MKKVFIIILCVLACGCTTKYNLEISNNLFKEDIDVIIDKDNIVEFDDENVNSEVEVDDQITPFLKRDDYSIGKIKKYRKRIKKLDNYTNVNLFYTYDEKEFKNANTLDCFEHHTYKFDDIYYIHGFGSFYCLYTDSLEIAIKTNNNVISNNADLVNGNKYIWYVNNDNVNNFDLEIEIEKGFSRDITIYIIVIVCISFVSFVLYNIARGRNKKNNSI